MAIFIEEQDISVDSQGVATWDINLTGAIGGTYQGTFTFRSILSPIQQIEADRDFRDLLGKNAEFASTHVENLAYTISQLRFRVISAPPFWYDGASKFPGSQIKDDDILQAILEASIAAEAKYRKMLAEKHDKAIERLKKAIEDKEKEAEPKKKSRKKANDSPG